MKPPFELNNMEKEQKTEKYSESSFLKRQVDFWKLRLKSLLTAGLSPAKIAAGTALGFWVGTFPVLGTHTVLGIILAFIFRLNQIAVYFGVWISLPFFILLLIPSLRVGEIIFRAEHLNGTHFIESIEVLTRSMDDFKMVISEYGRSLFHLLVGWFVVGTLVALTVYFLAYFVILILKKRNKNQRKIA